jgi:glycosyltransferase involved in cell wall biosynthesis
MLNVLLDTSPLKNGHGGRGIGTYTRLLAQELSKQSDLRLQTESNDNISPDVIHYPFFDLFFDTLPFKKKIPTIVTIHDVIPLMFPEYYKPGIKGKARFLKQVAALRSVKAVITDSEFSRQQITQYLKLKPDQIYVVYLAADPQLSKPVTSVIEAKTKQFKLPEKYILYVGDINYNKNIPQLIKLLKFLPDEIHLVCVGANFKPQPIPEWQWIETQMAMSDVVDRVTFISDLPVGETETLASLYSGSICYVQPSLAEGFGLPVLEAMQCRTPVVTSNVSSLPEIGGEYALYADPVAESLAEKVKEVLDWSNHKRQQWLKDAFTWSQRFSWQQAADQTAAIYRQVYHASK